MDIYVSKLQTNGQWGPPVNLGTMVNTPLNEDTPFITENDSMLYFSSQGHENMGGYDIFVSKLKASGQWSEPENLRYPINTTDDDLFFYPWNNAQVGYISLIREGGQGMKDIYAVQPDDAKPLDILLADFFEKSEKALAIPAGSSSAGRNACHNPQLTSHTCFGYLLLNLFLLLHPMKLNWIRFILPLIIFNSPMQVRNKLINWFSC